MLLHGFDKSSRELERGIFDEIKLDAAAKAFYAPRANIIFQDHHIWHFHVRYRCGVVSPSELDDNLVVEVELAARALARRNLFDAKVLQRLLHDGCSICLNRCAVLLSVSEEIGVLSTYV